MVGGRLDSYVCPDLINLGSGFMFLFAYLSSISGRGQQTLRPDRKYFRLCVCLATTQLCLCSQKALDARLVKVPGYVLRKPFMDLEII